MDNYSKFMMFNTYASLIEKEIMTIEKQKGIVILKEQAAIADEDYYPQFDLQFQKEASEMSRHYELFYCLERQIRGVIEETLLAEKGDQWWETAVPKSIQDDAKKRMKREKDAAISMRSEKEIDYLNFGELGEIVRENWDSFDPIFSSQRAFDRIMFDLNRLRSPIAHSCLLPEDDILRLRLTVKGLFRLME